MLQKNVYYAMRPSNVEVYRIGTSYRARVDFPTNIREILDAEENTIFVADVYSLELDWRNNLEKDIQLNYDYWFSRARQVAPIQPTLQVAIEAINLLTDLVLGGE